MQVSSPNVERESHLIARLGDVPAGTKDDLTVTGSKANLSLGDDGVLILPGVQVWQHQRSDRKWMLNYGHGSTGVASPQLEVDTDRAR